MLKDEKGGMLKYTRTNLYFFYFYSNKLFINYQIIHKIFFK